jgi:hypothetical protein
MRRKDVRSEKKKRKKGRRKKSGMKGGRWSGWVWESGVGGGGVRVEEIAEERGSEVVKSEEAGCEYAPVTMFLNYYYCRRVLPVR